MDQNIFTPDIQRGTFERVVGTIAAQMGISPDQFKRGFKVMPSVLKLGQYLNPGLSTYALSPRKAVDPAIPNTILLDQNDFFAITGIGLRIGRAEFAAGVYSNHGNYPLMTFPDPNYFTGNGSVVGSEPNGLQCLVNGTVGISVNNDAQVDGILAQELFFNPDGTYTSSPVAFPSFGGSEGERGIFPLTPQIILDAAADNAIVVNLANGAKANIDGAISATTTDSGKRNILYVVLYGYKIKNLSGSGNAGLACGKV